MGKALYSDAGQEQKQSISSDRKTIYMERVKEMLDRERRPTQLLTATDELRQLILENPSLPMLVFAGDDCNSGEYTYMSCSGCHAVLGEFLDCLQEVNDERVYTDRDEFGEALADHLYYKYNDWDGSESEWDAYVERRIADYDPYWKPCIILYVDN